MHASANSDLRDKFKPDILVRCGPRNDRSLTVVDPIVVVGVISPSTMDYDRGKKLEAYKLFPTLRRIVIVYSDERRVECYVRDAGEWDRTVLASCDDRLALEAVGFDMAMNEIDDDADLA